MVRKADPPSNAEQVLADELTVLGSIVDEAVDLWEDLSWAFAVLSDPAQWDDAVVEQARSLAPLRAEQREAALAALASGTQRVEQAVEAYREARAAERQEATT